MDHITYGIWGLVSSPRIILLRCVNTGQSPVLEVQSAYSILSTEFLWAHDIQELSKIKKNSTEQGKCIIPMIKLESDIC